MSMKKCSVTWCKNPVFSKSYCKMHQYMRADYGKIKRKEKSRQAQGGIYKNILYKSACDAVDREAVANKDCYCFFCGKPLTDKFDHHHLRGRVGKYLTDKTYLVLAHRDCHTAYHSFSVSQLLETGWMGSFLVRLRNKDEITYNKEMRKLIKYFEL